MPTLRLDESAQELLCQQEWRGNIRQLRNIAEQMSILEKDRGKVDLPDGIEIIWNKDYINLEKN